MATRWGICSAGKISHDFCGALLTLPPEEHQIVAVAARDLSDAQTFAQKFNIPKAYGSYEAMAKDDDIDVVYIATIHTHHYFTARMFLRYERNILCEKPLTLTLEGTKELVDEARSRGLFFMEGYWSRCFPVYDHIRRLLREGALGEVRQVVANICLPLDTVPRIRDRALGGGGLMDIGCYAVQACNLVFKGPPEKITALAHYFQEGVDVGGCISLKYPGGRLASLAYDISTVDGTNRLTILGTKDFITVPGHFWCPDSLTTSQGTTEFPFPECHKSFNFENSIGFIYEIQAVRDCLKKGLKECPVIPHSDTETIMTILEEVQKQLGVTYDAY